MTETVLRFFIQIYTNSFCMGSSIYNKNPFSAQRADGDCVLIPYSRYFSGIFRGGGGGVVKNIGFVVK